MRGLMRLCELQLRLLLLLLLLALLLVRLEMGVVRVMIRSSFSCFSLVVDCTSVTVIQEELVRWEDFLAVSTPARVTLFELHKVHQSQVSFEHV